MISGFGKRGSKERLSFGALLRCVRDLTAAFFRTQLFPRRNQGISWISAVKCFFQKNYILRSIESISVPRALFQIIPDWGLNGYFGPLSQAGQMQAAKSQARSSGPDRGSNPAARKETRAENPRYFREISWLCSTGQGVESKVYRARAG